MCIYCNLVLTLNDYAMQLVLPFIIFIHMHLASHLGSLDAPRKGCDVGAKPEDGVWWTYPEDERIKQVSGWEMLAKRVSSVTH
jgi:hypothetical protein